MHCYNLQILVQGIVNTYDYRAELEIIKKLEKEIIELNVKIHNLENPEAF